MSSELVVLAGGAGVMDKALVHTTHTPLHYAFSAWVVRSGEVLVSRRALAKQTWPGVWTNSFCGHPGPGESNEAAVRRRAAFELGLKHLGTVEEVLPDFSYRAVDSSGIVEHEICPVFVVEVAAGVEPVPNPAEVDSYLWVAAAELVEAVDAASFAFSPWMVEELAHAELRARLLA